MNCFTAYRLPCLALLLLCLQSFGATDTRASCLGAPSDLGNVLKAAHQTVDVMGANPQIYSKAPGLFEKPFAAARLAAIGAERMCQCAGSDNAMSCMSDKITKKDICDAYEALGAVGAVDFTNPFAVMALAYPPVGVPAAIAYEIFNGDSANMFCDPSQKEIGLLCCKLSIDGDFCRTATKRQPHVTCLGVSSEYSPRIMGEADPKWGCLHVPGCSPSEVARQDDQSRSARVAEWSSNLSKAFGNAVYGQNAGTPGSTSCTADFPFFVGCRGWLDVAERGEPYVAAASLDLNAPTTSVMDENFQQQTFVAAAQRIMYAVPNGVKRFEYIAARLWDTRAKADYLDGVDPVVEFSKWLSPCGLELLQTSLPETWELLAVPAPGEGPLDKSEEDVDWRDGCVAGQPPTSLSVTVSMLGTEASVDVQVTDPEAEPNGTDHNPLSIGWGDGTVTGEHFVHGAGNTYSHTYSATGSYSIQVNYINDAGLLISRTVTAP